MLKTEPDAVRRSASLLMKACADAGSSSDMLYGFGAAKEDLFKIAKKNILEKYLFALFPMSFGLLPWMQTP